MAHSCRSFSWYVFFDQCLYEFKQCDCEDVSLILILRYMINLKRLSSFFY